MADTNAKLRAVLAASKTLTVLSKINLQVVDVAMRADVHGVLGRRLEALEAEAKEPADAES